MPSRLTRNLKLCLASAISLGLIGGSAAAAEKKDFKIAWSIYVGWMPWGYASDSGIAKKWADKYGLNIEIKQFNDYVECDQPVHGRRIRCRDRDEHGCPVHSRRRRRRHHRTDRR